MLFAETERLVISEMTPDMAEAVHLNSLDADNRRFVPDEVFETLQDAQETVDFLISRYGGEEGPFVYAVLRKEDGKNIGYVQLTPIGNEWEIGYHIAKAYTRQGYAAEAVRAFLPVMMEKMGLQTVWGICLAENLASRRVMEKCGFVKHYEGPGTYQGEEKDIICRYRYQKS